MAGEGQVDILFLLSQAETSSAFLKHLPAGELITLARTNSVIRAELHGFEEPPANFATQASGIRQELQIGHHNTARWKRLKSNAPYECSSSTHTKGVDIKPCRYCSRLICGACMTRASFANPGEQTFKNRCRSFCEECWTTGNRHKRQKITDDCVCHQDIEKDGPESKQGSAEVTKTCECTNTKDGWVCLECKYLQNAVWRGSICFGEGCENQLDEAAERRKICMWCDKPLPITATRENPHVYKQKVVDALAREAAIRQADAEAHARRRQKRLKMTRRELRGSDGPFDDIPEYVRSLDTVNYTQLVGYRQVVPTSQQVYLSKQGKWEYNIGFLLAFRKYCTAISVPPSVREATKNKKNPDERTNQEVVEEAEVRKRETVGRYGPPPEKADDFQESVMRMAYAESSSLKDIQVSMFREYGIWKTLDRYNQLIREWKNEAELKASRARIAPQDRSAYWKDLGPSTGVLSNETLGIKDQLGLVPSQRALHHSPSPNVRQELTSGPLFPRALDVAIGNSTASGRAAINDDSATSHHQSPSVSKQNIQNLRDLSAKQAGLQNFASTNLEKLDHSHTARETMPNIPQIHQAELDRLIAAQEALREEYKRAFSPDISSQGSSEDDLDLLIVLQQSAMQTSATTRNESRPDGQPPVYFA